MNRDELREIARRWDGLVDEYVAELYDELEYKPYDRDLLARFAELAASSNRPVLDLGCGPGHISAHLGSLGLSVRGVDLSPRMIEAAARIRPDLDFDVGDMLEMQWPAESLGGAVAMYSLIHLVRADVPAVLRGVAGAVVGGGPLLVAVHSGTGTVEETEVFGRAVAMTATLFTQDEMTGYVAAAGFDIVHADTRPPYSQEYPSDRVYVLARKNRATTPPAGAASRGVRGARRT